MNVIDLPKSILFLKQQRESLLFERMIIHYLCNIFLLKIQHCKYVSVEEVTKLVLLLI
ncbi:hypothetical protein BAXH7_02720 [Bacillus amyloliquefaciens XH7]|nr:hypothetical protein LL3_02796 [Bacillus amyloliquefaciens LL3]AEK89846.1 hypothetical protein BAXH7_02720 [Bacillus amyloliquefaciens XH7]